MMIKKIFAIGFVAAGMLGVSCSGDDDGGTPTANLTIETTGLEALTGGLEYQGWLIVDGKPVGTSKFTDPSKTQSLTVSALDLEKATSFVLSIEPPNDSDEGPSATKILKGDFVTGSNIAELDATEVLGEFRNISGQYILKTPTDTVEDNNEFGIWFIKNNAAGLTLPDLGPGWKYEGWVVFGDTPVSTGTFSSATGADDLNIFQGSGGISPSFPGEDFLIKPSVVTIPGVDFPASVTGKKVVISIEPNPDTDPKPFFIKPLSKITGSDTGDANPYTMLADIPSITGQVTR